MKENEIQNTSVRVQFWIQMLINDEKLRQCKSIRQCERYIMSNVKRMEEGFSPLDEQCFKHAVEALPPRYKTSIKI